MTSKTHHKIQGKLKPKASTLLLISISLIIAIAGICSIWAIDWRMKWYAREEAREKAMILLDRNLATHTYFTHQLKPVLFDKFERYTEDGYFEPIWMSSTYAVREIDMYYQALAEKDYYYKEAAVNARSPENEADTYERAFIGKINESAELNEHSEVRRIDGIPYLVVLRRGESMEQSCLRCHSSPGNAPTDMVAAYGPDRSFRRNVGDVISAISIRIPLGDAYGNVNRLVFQLSVFFGATLLVVFGSATYLGKRWVFTPLRFIRTKTIEVSKNSEHLGEQIALPSNFELSELTEAFNAMSSLLRIERDQLELKVVERTEKLNELNVALAKEIDTHQKTILKLESSLKEIKTLRGILPICAHCKKIRNDEEGYWDQIENYISEHSEADFSHGVCPECLKKYYSELYND